LREAFNLTAVTQEYWDKVAENRAELNAIIANFEGALFNFSGRIVNVTDVLRLLNESLSNSQFWQDQLVAATANFSNSLIAFASNVSYALRHRGGFFNDLLNGLGDALEDAANGIVNVGEDGIDLVTDIAKKIYEVGKKASEGFWSFLGSGFGIASAVGTLISYILFMCIGVIACYFCYRNRKRLKKLASSKKDDDKTKETPPAPPPKPKVDLSQLKPSPPIKPASPTPTC
jgi:phage-related protein